MEEKVEQRKWGFEEGKTIEGGHTLGKLKHINIVEQLEIYKKMLDMANKKLTEVQTKINICRAMKPINKK